MNRENIILEGTVQHIAHDDSYFVLNGEKIYIPPNFFNNNSFDVTDQIKVNLAIRNNKKTILFFDFIKIK